MSGEETSTPGQAVALAEIEALERAYPPGTPGYTREIDSQRMQLYALAYPDEPEEGEAPAGRELPEQTRRRKDARPRATAGTSNLKDSLRELMEAEGIEPDDTGKSYVAAWGSHSPSYDDERQWAKVAKVAAKIGVSPQQLAQLHAVVLEDAPLDADDDEGEYSPDDYPPPFTIDDDASWAVFKEARQIAARHGVAPAAFKELAALVLVGNEAIGEPQMARMQAAAVDALVADWGDRAVTVVTNAQKAISHFGDGLGLKQLFNTPIAGALALGDHPKLIELFARIGQAIGLGALSREFASPNGSYSPPGNRGSSMSREAIKAQIRRLENEAPLGRRTKEQDREIQALYEAAYPDDEEDASRSAMGSTWGR